MPEFFKNDREKKLWVYTLLVVIGIFSSIFLGSSMASFFRDRGILSTTFWLGLILIGITVFVHGIRSKASITQFFVGFGIAGVYIIGLARMGVTEERSHIIEYSVLAIFMLELLKERNTSGFKGLSIPVAAILLTLGVSIIDEGIQFLVPDRVFDPFDLLFNTIATVGAVASSLILSWVRDKTIKKG